MKKLNAILIGIFTLCGNLVFGQQLPAEKSLLWEITGPGLSAPSYLYGTIHMICPADYSMSETIKNSFAKSKTLFLEIDMDDPSMNMKTLQLSMMKTGSLKDLMTDKEYTELEKFMKDSIGMPLMMFNKMKPFTLLSIMYMKVLPCTGVESYEQNFVEMAKAQKKEVYGLEKLEDQFAVFDKIPDSAEIKMILEMSRNFSEQKKEFSKMTESYKAKDLDALGNAISSSPDIAGFEDILLVDRNRNWISIMEKAMKKEPTFFAVGAGHLPGKEGVIELLRKEGYTVRAIDK
ncbi:TraB/GumN family protein [Pollutibacter soli]|uniref:TraB/GumN family protein n=1 Tax=Pollutibacter soli TaxID=3034157 RepID=UPI0030139973